MYNICICAKSGFHFNMGIFGPSSDHTKTNSDAKCRSNAIVEWKICVSNVAMLIINSQ